MIGSNQSHCARSESRVVCGLTGQNARTRHDPNLDRSCCNKKSRHESSRCRNEYDD